MLARRTVIFQNAIALTRIGLLNVFNWSKKELDGLSNILKGLQNLNEVVVVCNDALLLLEERDHAELHDTFGWIARSFYLMEWKGYVRGYSEPYYIGTITYHFINGFVPDIMKLSVELVEGIVRKNIPQPAPKHPNLPVVYGRRLWPHSLTRRIIQRYYQVHPRKSNGDYM